MKFKVPNSKPQVPNFKEKRTKMHKKNDLCERLLKFAIDVILYLRTVKKYNRNNGYETADCQSGNIKRS